MELELLFDNQHELDNNTQENDNQEIDLHAYDDCGLTVLHRASIQGSFERVKALLEKDAQNRARKCKKAMSGCCIIQKALCMVFGIKRAVNTVSKEGFTALHYAAVNGHTDVVELLIDHKANCNAYIARETITWTPLGLAIKNSREETAELLLRKGAHARLEKRVWRSFQYAHAGETEIVSFLISHPDEFHDIEMIHITPGDNAESLWEAARKGNRELVKRLLNNKVIDRKAVYSNSALYSSVSRNHPDLFMLLLKGRMYILVDELSTDANKKMFALLCCFHRINTPHRKPFCKGIIKKILDYSEEYRSFAILGAAQGTTLDTFLPTIIRRTKHLVNQEVVVELLAQTCLDTFKEYCTLLGSLYNRPQSQYIAMPENNGKLRYYTLRGILFNIEKLLSKLVNIWLTQDLVTS